MFPHYLAPDIGADTVDIKLELAWSLSVLSSSTTLEKRFLLLLEVLGSSSSGATFKASLALNFDTRIIMGTLNRLD